MKLPLGCVKRNIPGHVTKRLTGARSGFRPICHAPNTPRPMHR